VQSQDYAILAAFENQNGLRASLCRGTTSSALVANAAAQHSEATASISCRASRALSNETVRLNNLIDNNQVSSETTKELARTAVTSINSFDESIQRLVNCTQDSLRCSEETNIISQDIEASSVEQLRKQLLQQNHSKSMFALLFLLHNLLMKVHRICFI
jgi:F0F1-type ATP synthase delta subunit